MDRVIAEVSNPEDLRISITVNLSQSQWKEFLASLPVDAHAWSAVGIVMQGIESALAELASKKVLRLDWEANAIRR
jgi:hypothetical protein